MVQSKLCTNIRRKEIIYIPKRMMQSTTTRTSNATTNKAKTQNISEENVNKSVVEQTQRVPDNIDLEISADPLPDVQPKEDHGYHEVHIKKPKANTTEQILREQLGNETYDDLYKETKTKYEELLEPLNNMIKDADSITQQTDTVLKGIVHNLDELGSEMGVHIEKSEKLTLEWAALLSKLDAFIKTIKRFKKYIGYSTAIVLILTFLFKMGIARQIPNFFCDLVRLLIRNWPFDSF